MPKYCSENERVKRDYAFFLETASGKQDATIDAALRAIDRFETSTGHRPFSKFHIEQARSFRAGPHRPNRPEWTPSQRGNDHDHAEAPAQLLPVAIARARFPLEAQRQRCELFHTVRTGSSHCGGAAGGACSDPE